MARDSLGIVEFIMDLEQQFDVELLGESVERIRSRDDLTVARIYELLTAASSTPASNDPRWHRLVVLVAKYMDVPADDVTPDTRPFAS